MNEAPVTKKKKKKKVAKILFSKRKTRRIISSLTFVSRFFSDSSQALKSLL